VPPLKDKLENALNEGRILMLGVQVVIGFDYRAVFEERFRELPRGLQQVKLASLACLIVSLALLVAPIPYHWIAGRGRNFRGLHDYAQTAIEVALLPFGVAMGLDVLVASHHIVSPVMSYLLGGATVILAGVFWYGLGYSQRKEKRMAANSKDENPPELKDRIKEVLIETRIAVPGVQATLGFQFIIVLAASFASLPQSLKYVHLASLLCSALCAVLLIAPAAYHRIALKGEDSEDFLRFAHRILLVALIPLALAITGDVIVVAWKVTESMSLAIALASASLLVTLGFWFGYMFWRRARTAT
jgi:hypothetical protein